MFYWWFFNQCIAAEVSYDELNDISRCFIFFTALQVLIRHLEAADRWGR